MNIKPDKDELLSLIGIYGGPRALPVDRFIEALTTILSFQFKGVKLIHDVEYCIFFQIGGGISDIKDSDCRCTYYKATKKMFSTFSISEQSLFAMNDNTIRLWLLRVIELNLLALKSRSLKIQPNLDTTEFDIASANALKEFSVVELAAESKIELMYRRDVLPAIDSAFREVVSKLHET